MQRVNFVLRLCLFGFIGIILFNECASAHSYVPSRKYVGKRRMYRGEQLPPGMVRRSEGKRRMARTVYRARPKASYQRPSNHFQKRLVGPYAGVGVGVQMHRHDGRASDNFPQEHQFDANAQGFGAEISLGYMFDLQNDFFLGAELGLTPFPLKTSMDISNSSTAIDIKGQLGYSLTGILGRHYLDGQALIYGRLGLEARCFNATHEVQNNNNDDINIDKNLIGFAPGLGIGFLLCNYVYMVGEFRTIFYRSFKASSRNNIIGFNDKTPRVDFFLLKFILPLNNCFGTNFGFCDD